MLLTRRNTTYISLTDRIDEFRFCRFAFWRRIQRNTERTLVLKMCSCYYSLTSQEEMNGDINERRKHDIRKVHPKEKNRISERAISKGRKCGHGSFNDNVLRYRAGTEESRRIFRL